MLTRIEAAELIVGYTFDLQSNEMLPSIVPNHDAGTTHLFRAWKVRGGLLTRLSLRDLQSMRLEGDALDDEVNG